MAHAARINDENIVEEVLVIPAEQQHRVQDFMEEINLPGRWLLTSYNTHGGINRTGGTAFRKNFAGEGYTYDEGRDAFISPKPYPSWTLSENTCLWKPPVPYPTDGIVYNWNEELVDWEAVIN